MIRTARGGTALPPGARASRPHAVPLAAAELQCDALQAATLSGGNSIGQAEGEPWRRSRLIQVGEMAEAVPGLVRAGRPRSRGAIILRAGRPRSREAIIVRAGRPRSQGDPFWALLVVQAGPSVFRSIRVYSCPLVVRLLDSFLIIFRLFPRINRTRIIAGKRCLPDERRQPARMFILCCRCASVSRCRKAAGSRRREPPQADGESLAP